MSHTPHQLTEEFPEDIELIHRLKKLNMRFSKLADDYNAINFEIHRIEADITPTTDEVLTVLRKRRLVLCDEIAAMIRQERVPHPAIMLRAATHSAHPG